MFLIFWLAIAAILKGVISTKFDLSPIGSSHLWLILPDLMFFSAVLYFLFIKEKLKLTFKLGVFLFAYLGSIIWDYQWGFYFLKYTFPGILFLILNSEKLQKASLKELFMFIAPAIVLPLPALAVSSVGVLKKELFNSNDSTLQTNSIENSQNSNTHPNPYRKAIFIGILLGLFVLVLLAGLDPDFNEFLQKTKWITHLLHSLVAYVGYIAMFLYFFYMPVKANFDFKEEIPNIIFITQFAIVLILGILIGYTLYDSFILMRAFKFIALTYESVGKNTQMYFVELVVLGGFWLFLGSYILDKLNNSEKLDNAQTKAKGFLLVSMLWLMPPIYNILRALLSVYIPQYGITALRLFGLYTCAAFIIAFGFLILNIVTKKHKAFSETILSFALSLLILSYALPNNIFIANYHFSRYLNNQDHDFNYFRKVRMHKWGHLLLTKLDGEKYKTDNLWGKYLAEQIRDKNKEQAYKDRMSKLLSFEKAHISTLINTQDFETLVKTYKGGKDYWYYSGGKIPGVTLVAKQDDDSHSINSLDYEYGLSDSAFHVEILRSYSFMPMQETKYVEPTYKPARYNDNTDRISLGVNTKRSSNTFLVLGSKNLLPFFIENSKVECKESDNSCLYDAHCERKMSNYLKNSTYPNISQSAAEQFLKQSNSISCM